MSNHGEDASFTPSDNPGASPERPTSDGAVPQGRSKPVETLATCYKFAETPETASTSPKECEVREAGCGITRNSRQSRVRQYI